MSTDRLTYRERREAKADKLRGWADKRDARSTAEYNASRAATAGIPFGQPILVGHHSEGRHRRALERADNAMRAACEDSSKAAEMRSRADGIEAGAAAAIYSDDPDAIEALSAKIARLEDQRTAIKTANADYRKAHRAELKGMTAWERDNAMPHRAYELQNLGGNLSRLRARLAGLERERDHGPVDRRILARFDSSCELCGAPLIKGTVIRYNRTDGARCLECPTTEGA